VKDSAFRAALLAFRDKEFLTISARPASSPIECCLAGGKLQDQQNTDDAASGRARGQQMIRFGSFVVNSVKPVGSSQGGEACEQSRMHRDRSPSRRDRRWSTSLVRARAEGSADADEHSNRRSHEFAPPWTGAGVVAASPAKSRATVCPSNEATAARPWRNSGTGTPNLGRPAAS